MNRVRGATVFSCGDQSVTRTSSGNIRTLAAAGFDWLPLLLNSVAHWARVKNLRLKWVYPESKEREKNKAMENKSSWRNELFRRTRTVNTKTLIDSGKPRQSRFKNKVLVQAP